MATNKKTSPKVTADLIITVVGVVILSMLAAVTPEMLSFAGEWTPVIYAGIVGLAGVLGAYVKRDPDREFPDPVVGVPDEPRH